MYVLMIYLPGVETGAPHDDEQEGSKQSRVDLSGLLT
jgi:hypothetical protein